MLFSDLIHHSALAIAISGNDHAWASKRTLLNPMPSQNATYIGPFSDTMLSQAELLEIDRAVSRDFSPLFITAVPDNAKRITLTSRELLDISEMISVAYQPRITKTAKLIVLPVDPGHLYVYWQQPAVGQSQGHTEADHQALLRIHIQSSDTQVDGRNMQSWFDIAVQPTTYQQKIAIPPSVAETVYSAQLGEFYADDRFVAVADSNAVRVPRQDSGICHNIGQAAAVDDLPGLSGLAGSAAKQQARASGQRYPHA